MRAALLICLVASLGCAHRARPADPVQWGEAHRDCQRGAADACLWVGVSREECGDYAGAKKLYTPACEAGVADACSQLAHLVFDGRGQPKDQELGVRLAQQACEAGSAQACHLVGVALFRGQGIQKNMVTSTSYYARACRAEDASSCRDYAKALNEGRGGPVDVPAARALWRKTCPEDLVSCSLLAQSLKADDPEAALQVAREGCRAGGAAACHWAGDWYSERKDLENAARYLRAGCAWGEVNSCPYLGSVLRMMDPPRNYEAELVWTESCAAGTEKACHRLARYKIIRDGRSEGEVARIEALCRGGLSESCDWLCADTKKDLTSAACQTACSRGSREYCAQ